VNPIAVGIGVDAETLGRLNPVMMVHRVVRELPQRDDRAGLMKRTDDQIRWRAGKARRLKTGNARRIPGVGAGARQFAERDPFRDECRGFSHGDPVADCLQVCGDLTCQHLDVARAEHTERAS